MPVKKMSGSKAEAAKKREASKAARVARERDRMERSIRQAERSSIPPGMVRLAVKLKSGAAYEVAPELERVIGAVGSNAVADILGVSRSQPSRWRSATEQMSPASRRAITDLDHVLSRLLQVLWPEQASEWLTAPNPFLSGGRPVDVLRLRGASPVLEAIDALAAGAFA